MKGEGEVGGEKGGEKEIGRREGSGRWGRGGEKGDRGKEMCGGEEVGGR